MARNEVTEEPSVLNLNLRVCSEQDTPRILELCRHFQEESNYPFPFDQEYVQGFVSDLLSQSNALILGLSDHQGELQGVLGAIVVNHPFFNIPFASELIFWIEPEYRGNKKSVEMIQAYEYWAVNKMGCKIVTLDNQADSLDLLYEKLNYNKTMHQWSKMF